jgi:hypothetical protein
MALTAPGSAVPGEVIPGLMDPGYPAAAAQVGPPVIFGTGTPVTLWSAGIPYTS